MKMNGGKVGIVMMILKTEKKNLNRFFSNTESQERSTYIREI